MCQENSVIVEKKVVRGYRIYRVCTIEESWRGHAKEGELASFFDTYSIPPIGVKTPAEGQPFHMYKSREGLRKAIREIKDWRESSRKKLRKCKIFLCELEDGLLEGDWDYHKGIKSYTGKTLTILKEVRR